MNFDHVLWIVFRAAASVFGITFFYLISEISVANDLHCFQPGFSRRPTVMGLILFYLYYMCLGLFGTLPLMYVTGIFGNMDLTIATIIIYAITAVFGIRKGYQERFEFKPDNTVVERFKHVPKDSKYDDW